MRPKDFAIPKRPMTIVLTFIAAALLVPQYAWADNVATRWIVQAFNAVRSSIPAIHTGTPGASRTYAMTTAAMYDAVNGIDRAAGSSNVKPAIVSSDGAPAGGDRQHAAAAAAHAVLVALFPARQTTLDAALAPDCPLPITDASEAGCRWGHDVGGAVVAARSTDGTQVGETQPGGTGAGVFPRNFANAQFRNMTPFGIMSSAPYLSPGPPALSSERYAADFNEVKDIGSSTDTDAERAAITRHWLAEGGTVRETGLWLKAALNIVEDQGTDNSLSDTVRLFALMGIAVADALKTTWLDKYNHHYWRPGDAIRQGDIDGNDFTIQDPSWNPRAGTCAPGANLATCSAFGGTPEHTSGTSEFAGAAATILAGFYCRDDIGFSFAGEQAGSQPRSYGGFKEAAREAGRSRVYGGIHFQFSIEAGYEGGKDIAREILRTRLVPDDSPCQGTTCVCMPE